jgi:galactokinase
MNESIKFPSPAREALDTFPVVFQNDVDSAGLLGAAWAPGRVNLIGEHTDYNDGFVLPMAVDRVAAFAGRARSDGTIRLWSTHFQQYAQFSLAGLPETFVQQHRTLPAWARYVLSVVTELLKTGITLVGFDAVLGGDVPLGGGMSSSAALEVATVQACALFSEGQFTIGNQGATLTPLQVATLCQRAGHLASGVRSGILDQAASCLGRPEAAILLDCRSLSYHYLPFITSKLVLLTIDTGVRRELATSAYNERRQQCEDTAHLLRNLIISHEPENETGQDIRTLRDITQEQLSRYGSHLPAILRRRASYVIAENERVLQAAKLLERGIPETIGPLLWQSHTGLRDDYEVSCLELDALIEIAQQVPGVLGARMMGGGFGGCTINLVRAEAVEVLREAIDQQYPARTGRQASLDICRASNGPGKGWAI